MCVTVCLIIVFCFVNVYISLFSAISLAHSKLSSQAVVDGLLNGKGDLSTDLLENLLKFAPNDIEVGDTY